MVKIKKVPNRVRDVGRKYVSGWDKKKKKKTTEVFLSKQKGALHNFFKRSRPESETIITSSEANVEAVTVEADSEHTENTVVDVEGEENESNDLTLTGDQHVALGDDEQNVVLDPTTNLNDPAMWPENMEKSCIDYLLQKGPPPITLDSFPKNKNGRHFSKVHCKRKISNGETILRPWLIYSVSADKIYCFYCRLMGKQKSSFVNEGFNQWQSCTTRLAEHEKSYGHLDAMSSCCEAGARLSKKKGIDNIRQELIHSETKRWNQVFQRLVAIVQFLAERNLSFRGSVERIGEPSNGNFLGLVELLSKFDPVMEEHIRRVTDEEIHDHYLGKRIQNELITVLADAVVNAILRDIKNAMYFSVILDCTPDISHIEQMSLTIRYVSDGVNVEKSVAVHEHFIEFIPVESTTGEDLCDVLVNELQRLGLNVQNIRGQGYDNGANMKGVSSGVQKRILDINSRAFFTPCACHNYNLVVADMAKTCPDALTFFGIVQRVYTIFSASTKRWSLLKKYVSNLSLKPLCATRWESRIDSVKALRYQLPDVCDALDELADETDDAMIKSEAETLYETLTQFKFLVSLVLWYDVLFEVNLASKELQGETVHLSTAMDSFNNLMTWLKKVRVDGFSQILVAAKELAEEMEVVAIFPDRRQKKRKRNYDELAEDFTPANAEDDYRINCFNRIVDTAITSLQPRFEQLKSNHNLFGFLVNFKNLQRDDLRKLADSLEKALTSSTDQSADICGRELSDEMESLRRTLPDTLKTPVEILAFLSANERYTAFPNYFVALRIFLTIPVTVASGERSFSRLKLIRNYLRSTIHQDRLNNLAILAIERDIGRQQDFDDILHDFATRKARKVKLLES